MAHFADIQDGTVTRVIVVDNKKLTADEETSGKAFLQKIGIEGDFVQCSYNANTRGCYPGIGYKYHPVLDEFYAPVKSFDAEPPAYEEYGGGYFVYSNIENHTVNNEDGEERTVWTATATWQAEEPEA